MTRAIGKCFMQPFHTLRFFVSVANFFCSTTPSFVAFTDTERLIGDAAKNQVAMNPMNTVFDAKRLIGRKFADAEVQADMKHFPFKVIDKSGKPAIEVEFKGEKKTFTPEEISSMVLTKMRETAEMYLGVSFHSKNF